MLLQLDRRTTKIYDHTDYWAQLEKDLLAAKTRILIQSPFVTQRCVERWEPLLRRLIASGKDVCIIITDPDPDVLVDERTKNKILQADAVYRYLKKICENTYRRHGIHAKFLIIDEKLLWEGSLNYLSHYNTTEHLRRTISIADVREVKMRHKLDLQKSSVDETIQEVIATVKDRRDELALTQTESAKQVGITVSTLSRIQSGGVRVVHPMFCRLLEVLDLRLVAVPEYLYEATKRFVKEMHEKG